MSRMVLYSSALHVILVGILMALVYVRFPSDHPPPTGGESITFRVAQSENNVLELPGPSRESPGDALVTPAPVPTFGTPLVIVPDNNKIRPPATPEPTVAPVLTPVPRTPEPLITPEPKEVEPTPEVKTIERTPEVTPKKTATPKPSPTAKPKTPTPKPETPKPTPTKAVEPPKGKSPTPFPVQATLTPETRNSQTPPPGTAPVRPGSTPSTAPVRPGVPPPSGPTSASSNSTLSGIPGAQLGQVTIEAASGPGALPSIYAENARNAIKRNFGLTNLLRRRATCVVAFTVDREGVIGNIRVSRSSGIADLDALAVQAVEKTGRLAPLWDGYREPSAEMRVTFDFSKG